MNPQSGDWRESSACLSKDSSLFFPYHETATEKAVAICDGCPVRQECFDFATTARVPHGVFGGETQQARRQRLQIDSVGRPVGLYPDAA